LRIASVCFSSCLPEHVIMRSCTSSCTHCRITSCQRKNFVVIVSSFPFPEVRHPVLHLTAGQQVPKNQSAKIVRIVLIHLQCTLHFAVFAVYFEFAVHFLNLQTINYL
uniref:Uncharacterized protein n=1 Tax=Parascaris univalens TaxID=6257 RepID=A0A914ZGF1_PARUN